MLIYTQHCVHGVCLESHESVLEAFLTVYACHTFTPNSAWTGVIDALPADLDIPIDPYLSRETILYPKFALA